MKGLLQFSTWMYRKLLFLYPQDLRREFGGEIVLAFAADLEESGLLRVWRCALRELITVALPGQASNPVFLSPALAFLGTAITESAFVLVGIHQLPHLGGAEIVSMWLAALSASSVDAFVAFVVTCFYSRCSINVLRLD
jgi:hypothetical protein